MILENDYKIWIEGLKDKIKSAQLKAAIAVNIEMIMLYGILVKALQKTSWWTIGEKWISPTGCGTITQKWISSQPVGLIDEDNILCKIPWGHHIIILGKCETIDQAKFYIQQTIQNNWSRSVLVMQLETNLIDRQGKAQNNFEITLPKPQSDLAKETLKDPYKFDFLTLESDI